MPLTPEQIKALLAKPEKKRVGSKKSIDFLDPTSRNYEQWFKLATRMLDEETDEPLVCSNPSCIDNRPKHLAVVAEVLGVLMCRQCFIDGYMLVSKNQTTLVNT